MEAKTHYIASISPTKHLLTIKKRTYVYGSRKRKKAVDELISETKIIHIPRHKELRQVYKEFFFMGIEKETTEKEFIVYDYVAFKRYYGKILAEHALTENEVYFTGTEYLQKT